MEWLKKLFGKQELRVYIDGIRTPEQDEMFKEQLAIQAALGFERGDNTQNWLRMHQIMLDHQTRLTALESKK